MKLERDKTWWMNRALNEGDTPMSVGHLEFDKGVADSRSEPGLVASENAHLAFGRFVNLMRRQRNLSVEQLAEKSDLDASEVLLIEDDLRYTPEPRSVYQIATFLEVSPRGLMQLAGLTTSKDASLGRAAVRFAARSEPVSKLTKDETAALEAFVDVLSQFEDKKLSK